MKKIKYPIIVEGKYDKIKICSLFEATVFTTGGFSIFKNDEKIALLRKLAKTSGKIILLTDSDGGGHLIRSHIKTKLPPEYLINLYTPKTAGKEKRTREVSKEGILGVEGVDNEVLVSLLSPYTTDAPEKPAGEKITKADLYKYGLSGRDDSKSRREKLLTSLDLPQDMTPNAMLSAINILYTKEEFEKLLNN